MQIELGKLKTVNSLIVEELYSNAFGSVPSESSILDRISEVVELNGIELGLVNSLISGAIEGMNEGGSEFEAGYESAISEAIKLAPIAESELLNTVNLVRGTSEPNFNTASEIINSSSDQGQIKRKFSLAIICENKNVTVIHEEATPEKVRQYLDQLKDTLDTTWFGLCPLFSMEPTEANTRVLRRWCNASDRPIPDYHWRMLLILVNKINERNKKL